MAARLMGYVSASNTPTLVVALVAVLSRRTMAVQAAVVQAV
jgi:hypothetical protein